MGGPIDTSYFEMAMRDVSTKSSGWNKETTWLPNDHEELLSLITIFTQLMPNSYKSTAGKQLHAYVTDAQKNKIHAQQLDPRAIEMISSLFLQKDTPHALQSEAPLSAPTRAAQNLISAISSKIPDNQEFVPVWNRDPTSIPLWSIETDPFLEITVPRLRLRETLAYGGVLGWSNFASAVSSYPIMKNAPGLLQEIEEVTTRIFLNFDMFEDLIENNFYAQELGCFFLSDRGQKGSRIEEALPDILSILTLGPSSAFGIMAALCSFGENKLERTGLFRMLLVKATIEKLSIKTKQAWSDALDKEITCHIEASSPNIPYEIFKKSITFVAEKILSKKLASLSERSLLEISTWKQSDEGHSEILSSAFGEGLEITIRGKETPFTPEQILAGAVIASLKNGANLPETFKKMIAFLDTTRFNR